MAKVQLIRPEVAEKYDCNLEQDITIHARGYNGKISNVNLSGAKHLVESKTAYLTEKVAAQEKQPGANKK